MKNWWTLLALAPMIAGCPIGNNKYPKPRDLSPSWRIDKLRLLAIQAEPPEVEPGATVRFSALIVDPGDTSGTTIWLACPPDPDDPGAIGFGCQIDPNVDFSDLDAEALTEAGLIGVEPFLPPVYVVPPNILDSLDADERAEGLYVLVQAAALPGDALELAADTAASATEIDFNAVEVGYKRLVVSEADTPNRNPKIRHMSVDGVTIPPEATVEVDPEQEYTIGVTMVDGTVEAYSYTNASGVTEPRVEEPYLHWYTDGGTMVEELTLWPYFDATWESPKADDPVRSGTIWTVVRDRRGGMAWSQLRWRLRGEPASTSP